MRRWFVYLSSGLALVLLFGGATQRPRRLVFPIWIAVVSHIAENFWARFDEQEMQRDSARTDRLDSVATALHQTTDFFVLTAALSVGLIYFGVDANAFYIVLFVVAVILSMGAKDIIGDTMAGLIILVDQSFRPGNAVLIKVLNTFGIVAKIGKCTTSIRTFDHSEVSVPKAKIRQNEVVNYTDPGTDYRLQIDLGVAYAVDMEMVRWKIGSYLHRWRVLEEVGTALDVALVGAGIIYPTPPTRCK